MGAIALERFEAGLIEPLSLDIKAGISPLAIRRSEPLIAAQSGL